MPQKQTSLSKMRRMLWLMGVVQIPLIAYVKPKLIELDDEKSLVKIRLRRRTMNHLKSMYFGSLAVGADVAAGLHAYYFANKEGAKVSFAFKSVKAEFLKRATTDVFFLSKDGEIVEKAFKQAKESQERVNQVVCVEARNTEDEIVATFDMEISVKLKS
jgi:acyl-coenzyme A thioesterase PaaI-like protein